MKLKSEYLKQIRDALLAAFNSATLQSMVRVELKLNLDEIVTQPGTFPKQVEDLLRWAEERDRVEELVTGARKANPTNKQLATAEQNLLSSGEDAYATSVDSQSRGVSGERISSGQSSISDKDASDSRYYSCFISHSSEDREFAEKLYSDLQAAGVQCWFAPENMEIGQKVRNALDSAVLAHHKLLLIMSQHSTASDWVEQEVETAFEKERDSGELVLFPIRLDDKVFDLKVGWAAHIKRTRHIGDFRNWQNAESYRKSLQRILRDLTIKSVENNG